MTDTTTSPEINFDDLRKMLEVAAKNAAEPTTRKSLAPRVNWDNAQIGTYDDVMQAFKPIAHFAARIVETTEIRDDLNDPEDENVELLHRIEVVTTPRPENGEDDRVIHTIRGTVKDDELGHPEKWLKRFGAAVKSAGDNREGRFTDEAIGRAVSAYAAESRTRVRQSLLRTGWVDVDGWKFISHGNAIGADGNTDMVTGKLAASKQVSFIAPEGEGARERAIAGFKHITAALDTPDEHNKGGASHRTPGIALIGAACWTYAGFLTEHGVLIYTDMGAGKSTFLRPIVRSMMANGANSMLPSGSTGITIGDSYSHRHQTQYIIDDVSRAQSKKKEEEEIEQGIDRLARVAYDGPLAAARARSERSGFGGKYEQGTVDMSHCTFVLAGERIPQSGTPSGVSRMYGAPFRGVNKALIEDLEGIENMRAFWGYYLQEVAKLRDADLGAFEAEWAARVTERALENARKYGSKFGSDFEIKRRSRLLAIIQTGYEMAATLLGIKDEEWLERDLALLEVAAVEYTGDTKERRADGTENIMELLRARVATDNRFTIMGKEMMEVQNQRVLARHGRIDTASGPLEVTFIVPSVAYEVLGWEVNASSQESLERAIKPMLVEGARPKQRVSSGAASVKVYTILRSAWDDDVDGVDHGNVDDEEKPF